MSQEHGFATFGVWVKSRRRQLDLTQAELGAQAGCSAATIRKIEADLRKPSRQLAEILARLLEIPLSQQPAFLDMGRGILVEHIPAAGAESERSPSHNLPTLLTSTVDRTRDLAAVTTLFRESFAHLVTLLGPPGIGKTRLSVHCGTTLLNDYPDGVWFVDLAEIDRAEYFVPTLQRVIPNLGLPPSPALSQLVHALKGKSLLLIVDNCEHIIEGVAAQISQLLKSCPNLRILATSRTPLHLYGEHEYSLPPLSIPPARSLIAPGDLMAFEAVQLLVARVRLHQPGFSITAENSTAVLQICTVLEGIPLALELAAASTRRMSLEQVASLLAEASDGSWLSRLSTPARDFPTRQRTLENVIAWSYTRLDERQAALFSRLGIFPGWFDVQAAAEICFDPPAAPREILGKLEDLQDQSLLVRENRAGKPAWRMLEIIRAYARQQLDPVMHDHLENAFLRHILKVAKGIGSLADPRQVESFFEQNAADFLAAMELLVQRQAAETGLSLAISLGSLWDTYGYGKEGLAILKRLLALPGDAPSQVRAEQLESAADLAWQLSDFETALEYSRQAVDLARQGGMHGRYPTYLNRLGRIYIQQGRLPEARQVLEECLNLSKRNPKSLNPGIPLAQLGEVALFEGRLEDANLILLQAFALLSGKDDIFMAMTTTDLAEIALAQGQHRQAKEWLRQALPYNQAHTRRTLVFLVAMAGTLIHSPTPHLSEVRVAVELLGAIQEISDRSSYFLAPYYAALLTERRRMARQHLSDAEFRRAQQAGRTLTQEQALHRAVQYL